MKKNESTITDGMFWFIVIVSGGGWLLIERPVIFWLVAVPVAVLLLVYLFVWLFCYLRITKYKFNTLDFSQS